MCVCVLCSVVLCNIMINATCKLIVGSDCHCVFHFSFVGSYSDPGYSGSCVWT